MLDANALTENLATYAPGLARRGDEDLDLEGVKTVNEERKRLQKERDDAVHEQRELGPKIGAAKKKGEDAAELTGRSTAIKERIRELDQKLREANQELERRMLFIPNLPHPRTPEGGEDEGVVQRTEGAPPEFAFAPREHIELCERNALVELGERSTRLAGSSFVTFRGQGARLERGLIQLFLELHTREHGYTEVSPPFVVNERTLTGTGQLPKFAEDMYHVSDGLYLIPTAEVPVTNLHQEEILPGDALPFGYCSYTPCFRREAGAAGKMTKGLKRLHQFDKVELVRFARPDDSDAQHELLLSHCEEPLRRLGLHYRIRELAAGDLGFAAARCFDIEAWAPATREWLEVSSVSTFTDYQARRANIRFKDKPSAEVKKPKAAFVHTLNGSGLALPRLFLCLLETYQREDGAVDVPEVLRPYVGGLEVLGADPPRA